MHSWCSSVGWNLKCRFYTKFQTRFPEGTVTLPASHAFDAAVVLSLWDQVAVTVSWTSTRARQNSTLVSRSKTRHQLSTTCFHVSNTRDKQHTSDGYYTHVVVPMWLASSTNGFASCGYQVSRNWASFSTCGSVERLVVSLVVELVSAACTCCSLLRLSPHNRLV